MRPWSEVEKRQLQSLVNASYAMFVSDVATARKLDVTKRDEWANARVFLARDAAKLGLIDEVSDYFSAKRELERMSGVANPVWKQKPAFEKFLDNVAGESAKSLVNLFIPTVR